jgi:hypothetical protein
LKAEEIIRKLNTKEETIVKASSATQALRERLSASIGKFKAAKASNSTDQQLSDRGRYVIDAYEDLSFGDL